MKNKKKLIPIIIAVALLAIAAVGMSLAILVSSAGKLTNKFEPGSVRTIIEEDGEGTVKKSRIQNVGENDCLVRVRVTISPAKAAEAIELTGTNSDWDWSNWENGDGYVYYTKVLPVGEASYTSYVFEGVALKDGTDWKKLGLETFDVTVYEESVQVNVHNGTEMISALDADGKYDQDLADAVWAVYDSTLVTAQ